MSSFFVFKVNKTFLYLHDLMGLRLKPYMLLLVRLGLYVIFMYIIPMYIN